MPSWGRGRMFRTSGATAFFSAWETLRENKSIPHYRTIFERLSSELIPQLLILEEVSDTYVVRFMGTHFAEMLGEDLTSKDYLVGLRPKQAAVLRELLAEVVAVPCGLWTRTYLTAPRHSDLEIEKVMLPTTNDPDKPRRILTYGHLVQSGTFLTGNQKSMLLEHRWIDIGAGLPGMAASG